MRKKINLEKRKFGRLNVVSENGRTKNGKVLWKCVCECGNIKNIESYSLLSGHTKSCGCFRKEITKKRAITHGMGNTPIYAIWTAIKQRCNNPNCKSYKNYGGRGITICKRWLKFKNFFKDMGKRPKGLTIERINNDKGYSSDNCEWATRTKQVINRRINKNNKTGYVGIRIRYGKFRAEIRFKKQIYTIGAYSTIKKAILQRNQFIIHNNFPHKIQTYNENI